MTTNFNQEPKEREEAPSLSHLYMPDGSVAVVDLGTGEVGLHTPPNPILYHPEDYKKAKLIREERALDDSARSAIRKDIDRQNRHKRNSILGVMKGVDSPEVVFGAPIIIPLATLALSGVNMADGARRLVRPVADKTRNLKRNRQDKDLPPAHKPISGHKDTRYVHRSKQII